MDSQKTGVTKKTTLFKLAIVRIKSLNFGEAVIASEAKQSTFHA